MKNEDDIAEERRYFLSVIQTFKSYKVQSQLRIQHREQCLTTVPQHHQEMLLKYKSDLDNFKKAITKNSDFIEIVLQHAHNIFENVYCNEVPSHSETTVGTLSEGLDKVQSVFKQLMRDWSTLGAAEREQCYAPIIREIVKQYPEDTFDRHNIDVLVPGAGLGRLAFEIVSLGFRCEGNEFNLFMLIVSFYVLNHCKKENEFLIYPWIHQYCNNLTAEDQMLSVRFPDVVPKPDDNECKFSMIAGDFLEVYTEECKWDCVATCFFIDCAQNIVEFIERIYNILKPGGVWINLGPLLYHYSDMKNQQSIEPSFEVVSQVIKRIGFTIIKEETGVKTKYCQNPKSMLQYEYDSVFFVCKKGNVESDTNGFKSNGDF